MNKNSFQTIVAHGANHTVVIDTLMSADQSRSEINPGAGDPRLTPTMKVQNENHNNSKS